MKARFTTTQVDLLKMRLQLFLRIKINYFYIVLYFFSGIGGFYLSIGLPKTSNEWIFALVSGLAGIFILLLISFISSLFMSDKNPFIGEKEYDLHEDGLHYNTKSGQGVLKWNAIVSIFKTSSYITYRMNGNLFVIIPIDCFESRQEYDEYLQKSIEYWKNSERSVGAL